MAIVRRGQFPVVSVINMKGGVGKTLISANVFRELFRRKRKRVLLIDFDPQFNLSQLLLVRTDYDTLKTERKTLLYVVEPPTPTSVFQVSADDMLDVGNVDDFTRRLQYIVGEPNIEIRLLAGDFDLAKLNLRERDKSLRIPRRRFAEFIRKAREAYDLIVLDCNPSTSFLTRTALEVSTHLLVPIRPDRYSVLGATMLFDFMDYLPTVSTVAKKLLLLNGLPNLLSTPEADIVSQVRADTTLGPLTLVSVVPQSNVLKARPDYAGFSVDRGVPYSQDIKSRLGLVADEIASNLGF